MGSGRDKRKKAKERKEGPLPGSGTQKTEKKTSKNELKKERRAAKALENDEDNLEALLQRVTLQVWEGVGGCGVGGCGECGTSRLRKLGG